MRLLLFAIVLGFFGCSRINAPPRNLDDLRRLPLQAMTERELDELLRSGAGRPASSPDCAIYWARKALGQPYLLFCLGEFPVELIDSDPLYRLDASDCVTFVEQSYALAMARDWPTFFQALQSLRYRNGIIGFASRNHFTEADWNVNNAARFQEITQILAGDAAVVMKTRIDRATFFKRAGLERNLPVEIVEGHCIPRGAVDDIAPKLLNGDIIEFVRTEGEWSWVAHMGLIAHAPGGRVTLIHSGKPCVREIRLTAYLNIHPAFVGFKVLRSRSNAAPPTSNAANPP